MFFHHGKKPSKDRPPGKETAEPLNSLLEATLFSLVFCCRDAGALLDAACLRPEGCATAHGRFFLEAYDYNVNLAHGNGGSLSSPCSVHGAGTEGGIGTQVSV